MVSEQVRRHAAHAHGKRAVIFGDDVVCQLVDAAGGVGDDTLDNRFHQVAIAIVHVAGPSEGSQRGGGLKERCGSF